MAQLAGRDADDDRRCPATDGGHHEPDAATVTHDRSAADGVVDVSRRRCGRAGSFRLDPETIQW